MTLVLIKNANVFEPKPLGMQHLLIGGSRILWMGNESLELPVPLREVSTIIDAAGLRTIPGLIDGHVHVTGGGGEAGFRTRVPPVPLSRFTTAGITTVVGLLGTDDVARGPTDLLATLYALREEGLNAFGYAGGYHVPLATLTGSVRGDLVLLEALIGIGEVAISDHRSSQPTCDELLRIASECHVAGVMTGKAGILHLHLGDGPRGLELVRRALDQSELPARVFNPTHVNGGAPCSTKRSSWRDADRPSTSPHSRSRRTKTPSRPPKRSTLSGVRRARRPGHDQLRRRWLPALLRRRRAREPHGRRFRRRVAGTLRDALARGMALEAVLPAFTSNPARLLRLTRKGTIAAGHDADLVCWTRQARPIPSHPRRNPRPGRRPVLRGTFE